MKEVLKREYPKGIDLVYESVGGELFETCLNALAVGGRLVIIGMMSQVGAGSCAGTRLGENLSARRRGGPTSPPGAHTAGQRCCME